MTDTPTENLENTEVTPFTEGDREIAYRTDSNPTVAAGDSKRPAMIAPGAATGRRKEAIARVRIIPGSGQWKINGRTLEDYFPNKVHQQIVTEPFTTAGVEVPTTSSPASVVAASPDRPVRCVWVSPVRSITLTPRPHVRPSRRPAC